MRRAEPTSTQVTSPTVDRVRLGIVGIGNIAPINAAGYLEHPLCDVVAICEPREEKARRVAAEWGVPKVYTDLDALLADDEIDAVEILTPTHMHRDHVVAAARAGKHVSCQKPIANSVAEAREMIAACKEAGVVFRVSECALHYPPLEKARELIAAGAIGTPQVIRVKTLVAGQSKSKFQDALEYEGYIWRFNEQSPAGHLFDDVWHKYAAALWLADEPVRSVQAVVRQGPLFFEAPTAALWEYARDDLLGMMEVSYAPNMFMRTGYFGADEFFEIQGTDGWIWVTRYTGEMLDLPPVMLYGPDGTTTSYSDLDADWLNGFKRTSAHFIDSLIAGTQPDMDGELAIQTLQLVFAVYQASNETPSGRPDHDRDVGVAAVVAALPDQDLSARMAFDPIAASTTRVAEHREPVFVHEAQEAAAKARLDEYIARTGRRPNVLVILFDDVGWGDFGCYGGGVAVGAPTPNIDRLAREGLLLTSCYSEPSCSPSRVADDGPAPDAPRTAPPADVRGARWAPGRSDHCAAPRRRRLRHASRRQVAHG